MKTCEGCRALEMLTNSPSRCQLGYKFNDKFQPLEKCPKPRTYQKFLDAMKDRQAQKKRLTF